MDAEATRIIQELTTPASESMQQGVITHQTYKYDAQRDIEARAPNITFKQLMQLSPHIKKKLHERMTDVRPGQKVQEVNNLREAESEEEIFDKNTTCQVEDRLLLIREPVAV